MPVVNTEIIRVPREEIQFSDFLDKFHRDRFTAAHSRHFSVIIDLGSSRRQEIFLKALHHSTLKTRSFHYAVIGYVKNTTIDSDSTKA